MLEKKFLVIEKNFWNFAVKGQAFAIFFEITRAIYSNSERSEQFLKQIFFSNLLLEVPTNQINWSN